MIKNKTVVAVGAGVSSDLGLPLGPKLKEQVSDLLRDDRHIFRYFERAAIELFDRDRQRASNAAERACSLRDQIVSSASIDNFLDQHRTEKDLVSFVKMVIAYALADAEKNSALRDIARRSGAQVGNSYSRIISDNSSYFLYDFLNILIRGHQVDNFSASLSNLTFVIFNYDRCVERYLDVWFKFRFGDGVSWRVSGPNFIHVYGSLGDYFDRSVWNPFSHSGEMAFQNPHLELGKYVEKIKIFTEQEDSKIYQDIQDALGAAQAIVFLGFGFEEQNMRFFQGHSLGYDKSVFATVMGLSDVNKKHVEDELGDLFSPNARRVYTFDGKSKALIEEFYRPLTKAVGSL